MEIVYWGFIAVVGIAVLFTIKDWIRFVLNSFADNGFKFTLFLIILTILFIAPSFVKMMAPNYYGLSIWVLILYVAGCLVYRNLIKVSNKEG